MTDALRPKDRLFLLPLGFEDPKLDSGGKGWFCPDCAIVEGFLGFFPQVRDELEITYLPFTRPRHPLVDLIGEAHQGLPVLILEHSWDSDEVREANGHRFLTDGRPISRYLAARHGVSPPHP